MALQYSSEAGTLIIPGSYADAKVVSAPSGIASNGIIFAVGESDSGPSYAEEENLAKNGFGPDQKSEFLAKYGSGQLSDAFVNAVNASNDVGIPGNFTLFYPIKTNSSVKGSAALPAIGGGTYANITAKAAGKPGNLITRSITSTAEAVPTTGSFLLCSPQVSTEVSAIADGKAADTCTLAAGDTPTTMVASIAAMDRVIATGGVARAVINTTRNIAVAASGFTATFTANTAWAVTPTVGDLLRIPSGSLFATANEGAYAVLSATPTVIVAVKLLDAAGAGAAKTAPSTEASISSITPSDFECYSPVTISNEAGAVVPGLGKSLEIANTSTGVFSDLAFKFNSPTVAPTAVTWVSKASAPYVIASGQEYAVTLNVIRQRDAINENIYVGRGPVLSLGYVGTTATAVIANGVMTLTLVGGASSGLSPIVITLSDFPTVGALCQYLGSLGGFTAAPTLLTYSSVASTKLDPGTYQLATTHGAKTGRIKVDGADFASAIASDSVLVDVTPPGLATALVGLPDVVSLGFLSGGSRGATTNADIQGALDAMLAIKGNFVVPLFSNDASVDIAAGKTDVASTYDIASIHSMVRSHTLEASKYKNRKRRLSLNSFSGAFNDAKEAAGNMASYRAWMTFQNTSSGNASGTLTVFPSWNAAIKAAAMQAGGIYKDITGKFIQVNAATCPGYNPGLISHVEAALKSGLLPMTAESGFSWVSDQSTYAVDDNFVYNSLQAMYALDLIMATSEERMELAFKGQSLADVNATIGVTVFGNILDDLRKTFKLIGASDDAPRGFKDLVVKVLNGNAMVVSCQIKLATSIKFIPIVFMVSAITQSAQG